MVGVTGSIPVAPTISRPEKSTNLTHRDNCSDASSRLNKPRTVPTCLPDLGTAWAKGSRKVLEGALNAKRPASSPTKRGGHERSKSKLRETKGKGRFAVTHDRDRAPRNHVRTKNSAKECGAWQFRPQRSTARFCSPRCRKATQRARDRGMPISVVATRSGVGLEAVLSVTTTTGMSEGQKPQSVTLRRKPSKLDPRIVPHPKWPGMYRIRRRDGSLTDMVNLTRAKDALL
jgi:hypothetical protein